AGNVSFPAGLFDFFPFCGIHRPVILYTAPRDGIVDLTVVTEILGQNGRVHVHLQRLGSDPVTAHFRLSETDAEAVITLQGDSGEVTLEVPNAQLWRPG